MFLEGGATAMSATAGAATAQTLETDGSERITGRDSPAWDSPTFRIRSSWRGRRHESATE